MIDAQNYLIDSYKIIIKSLVDLFDDNGIDIDDVINAVKISEEERELLEEIIHEESNND